MSGLLPADDEVIEGALLGRPIASMVDVAYTYGRLDALYRAKRVDEAEFEVPEPTPDVVETDLDEDHVVAMTPDAHPGLLGRDDSLVSIDVVLSPDRPLRLYGERPVHVERVSWLDLIRHGYVERPRRSSAVDHSLPVAVKGKDHEKIEKYVRKRFEKWPEHAVEDEEFPDRDDAWVVESFADAPEDEVERAVDLVAGWIGAGGDEWDDDETYRNKNWHGFLSFRLWFEAGPGREPIGPYTPGFVPAINEVSAVNFSEQLASYSAADDAVVEDGVDDVTGERGRVFGSTPGRPLAYFHLKQQGTFDGFDADRSTARFSVTLPTTTAIMAGSRLIESCDEWVSGEGGSVSGFVAHFLPHVPIMSPSTARNVYGMVHEARRGDDTIAAELAETIETWAAPKDLRFQLVLTNTDVERNKHKVIAERLGSTITPTAALDRAHRAVVRDCRDRDGGLDLDRYSWDDRGLFDAERSQVVPILTGEYLDASMYDPDADKNSYVTSSTDPRITAVAGTVSGEGVLSTLLTESFARRLVREQNDLLDPKNDRRGIVPYERVAVQYVETNALARAGLIEGDRLPYPIMTNTTTDTADTTDDEPSRNHSRDEALDRFMREHTLLSPTGEGDPEYRAAFLLGGLVGRVSAYQLNEGVQSPIARRWTIDSINRTNFRKVFAAAADKNAEYEFAYNDGYALNERYLRQIRDVLADSDPREWDLREDGIRTAYALGLSYARDDKALLNDEGEGEPIDADAETEN